MESLAKPPPGPPSMPEFYPPWILAAVVFAVVGAVFAFSHQEDEREALRVQREWVPTTGQVTDYELRYSRGGSKYVVFLSYRAAGGTHTTETKRLAMSDFHDHFPHFGRNQDVEIYFSPDDPDEALWSPSTQASIAKREKKEAILQVLISLVVGIGLFIGYRLEKRSHPESLDDAKPSS